MPGLSRKSKKLTKADIIDTLYVKSSLERVEVRSFLELLFDSLKEALMRQQSIEIRGFGTFEVIKRKARSGARNPKTGEKIIAKPHCKVTFRSGRDLKQAIWSLNDEPSKK